MQNLTPRRSAQVEVVWRVVFQKPGGKLYVHRVKLNLEDNGMTAMEKLRREYHRTRAPYHFWDHGWVFGSSIIETTVLSLVRLPES